MSIVLIILLINSIHAQLNLYLDSASVQQLYGIFSWKSFIIFFFGFFFRVDLNDYQLYFINRNHVRQAALQSPIFVPADIHFVQLTWDVEQIPLHHTVSNNEKSRSLSVNSEFKCYSCMFRFWCVRCTYWFGSIVAKDVLWI